MSNTNKIELLGMLLQAYEAGCDGQSQDEMLCEMFPDHKNYEDKLLVNFNLQFSDSNESYSVLTDDKTWHNMLAKNLYIHVEHCWLNCARDLRYSTIRNNFAIAAWLQTNDHQVWDDFEIVKDPVGESALLPR